MKTFMSNIVREAGAVTLKYLDKPKKVNLKGEKDIVCDVDLKVERLLKKSIHDRFPSHSIVMEESDPIEGVSGYTWYLDPIDGTANYVHDSPLYCVSLGLAFKGKMKYGAVFLPVMNEFYFAEEGRGAYLNGDKIHVSLLDDIARSLIHVQISPFPGSIDASLNLYKKFHLEASRARDLGSCAIELCWVGSGRAEGMIRSAQKTWDFAAGTLVLEEGGGKVTDFSGNDIAIGTTDILASNKRLHATVLKMIQR